MNETTLDDSIKSIIGGLGEVEAVETPADDIRRGLIDSTAVRALPAPEPLIGGHLVRDSLALIYGQSGLAKTFVAIDMAMSVASGTMWHGQPVTAGPVLYVIGEGASGIGRRLDAWEAYTGVYRPDHSVWWLPWPVNVYDRGWTAALAEVVAERRPALVVLDTLARCTLGAEENSAKDVGQVVANLDTIRRAAGSCVAAVHHSGKDGAAGARGSSALRAAMDTEIELTGEPQHLVLKVTKQKDGPEPPAMHLSLESIDGTNSCALGPAGDVNADQLPAGVAATLDTLAEIDDPGGITVTVWRMASATAERTFYRHRKNLLGAGLVVNVGTERTPKYRPASALPDGA